MARTDIIAEGPPAIPTIEGFDQSKVALIKDMIAPDATNQELEMFLYQAHRSGLDPLLKQIYFIKRKKKEQDKDGKWIDKFVMTVQTGIDGLRLIAERTGMYDGQDGPYWCGKDGVWHDVWVSDQPPLAAKVEIYKKGLSRPFRAVVHMKDYAPMRDGKMTGQWQKMPSVMISKVCEAAALRKAFPMDMSGIYAAEEMDQADTRSVEATAPKNPPKVTVEHPADDPPPETEVTAIPPAPSSSHAKPSAADVTAFLKAHSEVADMADREFLSRCVQVVTQGTMAKDWTADQAHEAQRLLVAIKQLRVLATPEPAIEATLNSAYSAASTDKHLAALEAVEQMYHRIDELIPDNLPF